MVTSASDRGIQFFKGAMTERQLTDEGGHGLCGRVEIAHRAATADACWMAPCKLLRLRRTSLDAKHAMVARVGDVNVASARMDDYAVRFTELCLQSWAGDAVCTFSSYSGDGDELAFGDDELADEMIARVGDQQIAITIGPEVLYRI